MATVSLYLKFRKGDGKWTLAKAYYAHNRLKPGFCVVGGKPHHQPDGIYVLRHEGTWTTVGPDAYAAQDRQLALERELGKQGIDHPHLEPHSAKINIKDSVEAWLGELEITNGKSQNTRDQYRYLMDRFTKFCRKQHVEDLSRQDALDYVAALQAEGRSDNTIKQLVGGIVLWLGALIISRKANLEQRAMLTLRRELVCDVLKEIQAFPEHTKRYSDVELTKLFAAADAEEALLMSVFLRSGGRRQEVAHLRYSDLEFQQNIITFTPKADAGFRLKAKKGKDANGRSVPVPADLMAKLQARMSARKASPADWIFPKGDGSINEHHDVIIARVARRAGIPSPGLHRFRATAASLWSENLKWSIRTIQELLGHADVSTTMNYVTASTANDPSLHESLKSVTAFF